MDIKIFGITREIMAAALAQAREGRLHILGEMNKVLKAPREKMSDSGADHHEIDPEKIRDVIGKGGSGHHRGDRARRSTSTTMAR